MISFKAFIKEQYFDTVKSLYRNRTDADIHKNPSRAELIKITHQSDNKSVRGLLHPSGDAYFWDANRALHHDVAEHLEKQGVSGSSLHISVSRERGKPPTVTHYQDDANAVKSHPWAAKNLADHKHTTYEGEVSESWKSSWRKAGKDKSVRRTGVEATGAAVRTAKNIGRGIAGGAALGAVGGIETMKVTVPAVTAIAAIGSTLAGDIPKAAYHGTSYVAKRAAKTVVNRMREVMANRKKNVQEKYEPISFKGNHDLLSMAYAMRAQGHGRDHIATKLGYAPSVITRELDHPDVVDDYNKSEHAKTQPYIAGQKHRGSPKGVSRGGPAKPYIVDNERISKAYSLRKNGVEDEHITSRVFGGKTRRHMLQIRKILDHPEAQKRPDYHPADRDYKRKRYSQELKDKIFNHAKQSLDYKATAIDFNMKKKAVKRIVSNKLKEIRTNNEQG